MSFLGINEREKRKAAIEANLKVNSIRNEIEDKIRASDESDDEEQN
jgi:hypothetical protein